jgi:hypothetical protein
MRLVKQFVWLAALAMLVLGRESARAFSLGGPIANGPDSWQTLEIGYNVPGDLTAPKQAGNEFRRVTPIMYYAFNVNYLNYFGLEGVKALDKAFALFNGVTNVDLYTSNLVEFPDAAQRVNMRAVSLELTDVKSMTMGAMTEQLGLFQPGRAVWVLRNRFLPVGATCPTGEEYDVMQRNLDILSDSTDFRYNSYVNDTLYSYFIQEFCSTVPPGDPTADAVEFPVDPDAQTFTAVADYGSVWYAGLALGGYYTGLTRDDVAGLRYLIETNNLNPEDTGSDTIGFITNSQPTFIATQDLNLFTARAATNGPAALTLLYPGLIINSTVTTVIKTITTNINQGLKNAPLDPAGTAPTHPFFTTNYNTNVVNGFQYTFGNLVTNSFSTLGLVGNINLTLSNPPLSPAGTIPTLSINPKVSLVHGTFGNFFILPPNLCAAGIQSNILTQVIATTNLPTTNALIVGATNLVSFTPGSITFFTNSTVVYLPVTCPVDPVATRQGVGKLTFLRRDFDSLLNQFWSPITNDYTLYALSTNLNESPSIVPEHIRRVVTAPDFLFSASDLGFANATTLSPFRFSRNVPFNQANVPNNAAGPGTINQVPTSTITFNSMAPVFGIIGGGSFGTAQSPELIWGSFDGTTNDPIVYPNGASVTQLENQVLGPFIVTGSLPNGSIGNAYSANLTGTGGQPPYTWSLSPGSAWPSGLTNSVDGQISGIPTGPAAVYDLSIRITDSASNFNDVLFTLTIDP